jgi:hypothetical protein
MTILTSKPEIADGYRSADFVLDEGHESSRGQAFWGRLVLSIHEHRGGRLTMHLSRLSDGGWDSIPLDADETAKLRTLLNRAHRQRATERSTDV